MFGIFRNQLMHAQYLAFRVYRYMYQIQYFFFFRLSSNVKAEVRSTKSFTWVRKKKPVIANIFNSNVSNLYNDDVIIYRIEKSREQFCLWSSLPNFHIKTLVKFLRSFIKRTALHRPVTDIRGHIYYGCYCTINFIN